MSTGSVARSVRTALRTSTAWSSPVASTSRILLSSSPAQVSTCTCFQSTSKRYSSHYSAKPAGPSRKKRTILDVQSLKRKKIPITVLTAHDYPSARFIEASSAPSSTSDPAAPSHRRGIDIALVGDSLAMVACGYTSTTSLTLDEMLYHCRSVARGCHSSLLLADLPFGTYHTTEDGIKNAVRMIQEGNMDAIKLEGGKELVPLVERLTSRGIPVMSHIGLTPQRQAALSGFRVQGKTVAGALKVWEDAQALQAAGAFALLIEAIPSRLGRWMSERLEIPTIGIGAGAGADGQVLVQLDMLGVNSLERGPKFLKRFEDMERKATSAIEEYVKEVREGSFPHDEVHGYPIEDQEWEGFLEAVEQKPRK